MRNVFISKNCLWYIENFEAYFCAVQGNKIFNIFEDLKIFGPHSNNHCPIPIDKAYIEFLSFLQTNSLPASISLEISSSKGPF